MSGIVLTDHQQQAYDSIMADINTILATDGQWDNVVSLIGAAGVGKTLMTVMIIKELLKRGVNIQMTTPTHKALKVIRDMMSKEGIEVDASTIHSFLNLKLKPNYDNGLQELIADQFSKNKKRTDVLIVDESSMVSAELFEHIQTAINFRRAKAVLFVGDWYQLPPVDGEVNPVFEMKSQHELTEIVRQAKDNPIIGLATEIRERIENNDFIPLEQLVDKYECSNIELYNDGREFMNKFFSDDWTNRDQVIAAYTNATVDKYNRAVRKRYWKEKDGIDVEDYLMVGDTVVYNNNDILDIVEIEKIFDENLQIWYWACMDEDNVPFYVVDPISMETYNKRLEIIAKQANMAKGFEKKNLWELYYNIKQQFQSVKYAFSSTVHKLQGSTFEHCYIDMREMRKFFEFQEKEFIYRLLYVAVTRASKDIKILI
jgi:exodeoxyribonuclease-5